MLTWDGVSLKQKTSLAGDGGPEVQSRFGRFFVLRDDLDSSALVGSQAQVMRCVKNKEVITVGEGGTNPSPVMLLIVGDGGILAMRGS